MLRAETQHTYIWLESETPTAKSGLTELNAWPHEYFSGQWLHVSLEADKVKDAVQGDAVTLKYDFQAEKAGAYELWNRVGLEYVRSPFDWRLDGGDWKTASPEDLTVDLMEIGFWCEIAWLKLGDVNLSQGGHTLEIRLPKQDAEGKPQRILYASDCICFYQGKFEPYSKYKPDEDHRTDADRAAATRTMKMKGNQIPLSGIWEICRSDEMLPEPVAQPISSLPNTERWSAIQVPGDKNTLRPDLQFAHRVWYRTRLELSEKEAKNAFYITFPQNNLNTTVYVNGQLCGFNKNPYAKFQIDISNAVKPGLNVIYVGIRDAWYAFTEKADDPMKLRKKFNLPKKYFGDGFQDLVYPVWSHPQSGMLLEPTLTMTGPVYVSDVFIKPSVAKKTLEAEITVKNTRDREVTVNLESSVAGTPKAVLEFPAQAISLAAGEEKMFRVSRKWENPVLWTPENPKMYDFNVLITEKKPQASKSVSITPFGFREWSVDGKNFMLNGIPFHGWADCFDVPTKEEWLKFYRESNQSVMRFWGTTWKGMGPEDALNFFDQNGVVVRRSGVFDGEAIGYNIIENDPELRAMNKAEDPAKEELKMDLFRNWRDQMVAQVRGERNHPSVMIWSIENEILYINCINLYGGLMDQFEDEVIKTAKAVKEVDPTRTSMVDGGGACKNNGLEVAGDHYVVSDFTKYPDRAYEPFPEGGGRGRWVWDEKRPRFIGEDFYVNGFTPADFAVIGGEEAFGGRTAAKRGVGILYRMLTEGYRWSEYGAWHFWTGQDRAENQYGANAPVAVLCKEWDWTFEAGQKVTRTMKVFNDTFSAKEIRFTAVWENERNLQVSEKRLANEKEMQQQTAFSRIFKVMPGKNEEFTLNLAVPRLWRTMKVGKGSGEGTLIFALSTKDAKTGEWREVFTDRKPVRIFNLDDGYILSIAMTPKSVYDPTAQTMGQENYGQLTLYTYDPKQSVEPWLRKRAGGKPIRSLDELADIKPPVGKAVLVVGRDALTAADCDSPAFQAFAAAGHRVVVLEQQFPLRYGALPCEMEVAENEGRTAFVEGQPWFYGGLTSADFFTWPDGHVVYKNAYKKPTRGGRSVLQCGNRLENAAVVEIPVGTGLMILSQVLVGEKLEKSVAAKLLLNGMIMRAARYELEYTPVTVCTRGLDARLRAELDAMQLKYATVDACVPELSAEKTAGIFILAATPENLKTLNESQQKLSAFYAAGGTVLLHGLTPDGLAEYNQLVKFPHMIRKFTREKVGFPAHRHPLTQGLTLADVALSSGERLFGWANDEYVASDTFTYVVDYGDVAPFAQYDNDFVKMMSNGMVSADGWPYIVNVPAPENPPLDFSLKFPAEQELTEMVWTGNTFYSPVTKIGLFFDGKADAGVTFDVAPNAEPQPLTFPKSIRGKNLTLRLAAWMPVPGKEKTTGLDNITLTAKRPAEFLENVKPLLNVGAIMEYRVGDEGAKAAAKNGRILLCNLNFPENEAVAANAVKKRNILATILRNLGAEFTESRAIIAGTPLDYAAVDISKQCNAFRSERGWFGDANFTFAAMPSGMGKYAGVPFMIYDFPTSPVPNCVIVGGDTAVQGVPVQRKADALFFLHTAKVDRRRNRDEIRDGRAFEVAKYVIHYADGQSVDVPVMAELDVDDYRRETVSPIPGATLGWVRKYDGSADSAVAYVKQWMNPRPEVEIKSVDVVGGKDGAGRLALLGITAASEP